MEFYRWWTLGIRYNELRHTMFILGHGGKLPPQHLHTKQNDAKYYSFSNIRYGQPPIGPLRFAAPVAATEDRRVQSGDVERRCYQGRYSHT